MQPPIQLVKVSDEGSRSPFIARIFFGLIHFRDQLHLLGVPDSDLAQSTRAFDTAFNPLLEAAQATRDAAREVLNMVSGHVQSVTSGEAVRFRANQYEILKNINAPLSQAIDKLVDQSIVATKGSLQPFLRDILMLDISFFFQKEAAFAQGSAALRTRGETALSTYLEAARSTWHADLQDLRSKHEHERWTLPGLQYTLVGNQQVAVGIPLILGHSVHEYARVTANRVLRFIEDIVLYAMIRKTPFPLFLVEIPPDRRDPSNPERFRLAPRGLDPSPPWEIYYGEAADFV